MTSAPFQVVNPAAGEMNPPCDVFTTGQVGVALDTAVDAYDEFIARFVGTSSSCARSTFAEQ